MSRENVEIVRQIFEAVASRDRERILELYDPGVEIDFAPGTLADHVGGTVWTGHEGLRSFDRELREAFEDFDTTCEELIDAGDYVVSVSRYRARGRSSGVEVDGPLQFLVWSLREGKVTRAAWYSTRQEALEAAGFQ